MWIAARVGQFLALAVGCACAWGFAPAGDPLHSPECDAARRVLDQALDAASARKAGAAAELDEARRRAIDECLGRDTGVRQRTGIPEPAVVVPPPVLQAHRPPAVPPALAPPPPPVAIPRPIVITTCDTAGCWDSEGHRLNNLGPMLVGPRGPCTVQGGLAQCP